MINFVLVQRDEDAAAFPGHNAQLTGSTLPRDLHMLINLRDNVSMSKKQGITANDLIEGKREELARLCAAYHVHRLELFGSATGEEFEPDTSDLDFLVEFEDLSRVIRRYENLDLLDQSVFVLDHPRSRLALQQALRLSSAPVTASLKKR